MALVGLTAGCGQLTSKTRVHARWADDGEALGSATSAVPPPRALGKASFRLEGFREELELDELGVDFDNSPNIKLMNSERDRTGIRAKFGTPAITGFLQIFKEEFRAPGLLQVEFDDFGFGGGITGAVPVGGSDQVKIVVPYKYELGIAAGVEKVSGFDLEWVYYSSSLEGGVGVQVAGLQPSVGFTVNSLYGLFESDNPASAANVDPAFVDGLNVGAYAELLYQPANTPISGTIRGYFGQVSGVMFSLGLQF